MTEEAVAARIDFIKKFPQLAPLMYSLEPSFEPRTVEEWLGVMRMAVGQAIEQNLDVELAQAEERRRANWEASLD